MALYRAGNHIYTPLYPDNAQGFIAHIINLETGALITSTIPYVTIDQAKKASEMLIMAREERELGE